MGVYTSIFSCSAQFTSNPMSESGFMIHLLCMLVMSCLAQCLSRTHNASEVMILYCTVTGITVSV